MNKTINLSDKSAVSFRKTIGMLSLVFSALTILAMLLGVVPVFQQSSNAFKMAINLFDIINIRSKPLLYFALRWGISAIYFVLLAFSIKNLIDLVKTMRLWNKDEHDTKSTRSSIASCVMIHNEIFTKFIVFAAVSYVLDSYALNPLANVVFAVLILLNFALNFMRMLFAKRDVFESVFSPLASTLILITALLFMFNTLDIEVDVFIRQVFNFLRMLFGLIKTVSIGYILRTFMTQVIIPAFCIYVLFKMISLFTKSISYGMKFMSFERTCKSFMMTSLVAFVVIVVTQIATAGVLSSWVLWNVVINNVEFVLLAVAVFYLSKNQGSSLPDAPAYDDLVQNTMEETQNETNENT